MHNPSQESAISRPINLLKHYSFESNHRSYERVLDSWLERFPLSWVNLALVESLYQGRYKVVSVEQILTLWQRRGKPSYHFNHDFERLVSNNLPQAFEKKGARPPQKPSPRRLQTFSNHPQQKPHPFQAHEVKLPPQPLHPSHQSDIRPQNLVVTTPAVTPETPLEATKPPTMTMGSESAFTTSAYSSDQSLVGPSAEQVSTDPNSYSSVPLSSPVGETLNPIHQFVPQSSSTEFCSKLTAMAQVNV